MKIPATNTYVIGIVVDIVETQCDGVWCDCSGRVFRRFGYYARYSSLESGVIYWRVRAITCHGHARKVLSQGISKARRELLTGVLRFSEVRRTQEFRSINILVRQASYDRLSDSRLEIAHQYTNIERRSGSPRGSPSEGMAEPVRQKEGADQSGIILPP